MQTLGVCIVDNGVGWERGVRCGRWGDVLHYIWYAMDVHASGSKFRSSSSFGTARFAVSVVCNFR